MASPYRINLPAYEGPLDLLLDLIRKQEMDIHNIPIAKITEQYLDYLHQLEKFDIDVSADFIYMAATLIHIKSKMLLPADPLAGPEGEQDPRDELVHRDRGAHPAARRSAQAMAPAGGRETPSLKDQLFEYACHEGNYALVDILSGVRSAEKAAASGGR